jgi:hypothetical protein
LGYISIVNGYAAYFTGTAAAILSDTTSSVGLWGFRCFDSIFLTNSVGMYIGGLGPSPGGGQQPLIVESINYSTPLEFFGITGTIRSPLEVSGGSGNLRFSDNSSLVITNTITTTGAVTARYNSVVNITTNSTPTGGFIVGVNSNVQVTRTTLVAGQSIESGDGSIICRVA